jgi:hypothetical protein
MAQKVTTARPIPCGSSVQSAVSGKVREDEVESIAHTTGSETTGKPLIEEPALFGLNRMKIRCSSGPRCEEHPEPQLRIAEKMFGDWLVSKKYGSLETALTGWKGEKLNRDVPAEGRVAFRPLWSIFSEKTSRDRR